MRCCRGARCTGAVQHGHGDVHEDDVRSRGPDAVNCLLAVGGFARDLHVVGGTEQRAEAGADQSVVVDDENPDHAVGTSIR